MTGVQTCALPICFPVTIGGPVTLPLTGNAPIRAYDDKEPATDAVYFKDYRILGEPKSTKGENSPDTWHIYGSTETGNAGTDQKLYTDLSSVTAATINQLRQAFQIQKLLEKDARGGTRYREVLREHFGVISPDSRMQIPEYLGGYRLPINVSQVIQTSSSDDTSPLGNTAALSVTTMNKPMFTKSFTEHGLIMGLAVVRTDQTNKQSNDE